jgi:uncharacterized protein (DUF488 family)
MREIVLYTIGFTKHSARDFFEKLRATRISHLVDIRRDNVSQLAGFAKRDDLDYFTRTILGVPYTHQPILAPTSELRNAYRSREITWEEYAERYLTQIGKADLSALLVPEWLDRACLLCSEHTADRCHRRLAAEYLAERSSAPTQIVHL